MDRNPICVECAKEMRAEKNGFIVAPGSASGPRLAGDKFRCPGCNRQVVANLAPEHTNVGGRVDLVFDEGYGIQQDGPEDGSPLQGNALDRALARMAADPEVEDDVRGRPLAPQTRCPHCLMPAPKGGFTKQNCPECGGELEPNVGIIEK